MATQTLPFLPENQAAAVHRALRTLARNLTQAYASPIPGDPEDQLKIHMQPFVVESGLALGRLGVVAKTESRVADVHGRPDLGVGVREVLTGHIELKAPGHGVDPRNFRGHDHDQWQNFKNLPNLIYTDGLDWILFHTGKRVEHGRLSGDLRFDGADAVTMSDAQQLGGLLQTFFSWQPIVPATPRRLAEILAPLARLLRRDVEKALDNPSSAISRLREDWKSTLFANADPPQFADAYAQALTYALLLARLDGLEVVGADLAQNLLRLRGHTLLADVLGTLTYHRAREEIETPVEMLERIIGAVDVDRLQRGGADPWLYFYEDFLAAYDPKLRNDRGVYYTPVQVVRAQVRLVGELLRGRFGKELTYAHDGVVTLDPAAGTGTYPLAVIEHALALVENRLGAGAVPGYASALARNVHAFELLVGPYAVAHLQVTQSIRAKDGELPDDGAHVYLADTLESPHPTPPGLMPLALQTLVDEHERARRIKADERVLVCLGNPPYDRQEIDPGDEETQQKGGWVRFGDPGVQPEVEEDARPLLEDFLDPVRQAGAGVHLKNLYNDYVYFWRWALWKVFESTGGPGIVSYITAASYLSGPGFAGMREVMRRTFDELWIIDLEGDSLGARKTENVFAIRTPVAIALGVRYGDSKPDEPATARYARLTGTAEEKLARLDRVCGFDDLTWRPCFQGWHERLLPQGSGDYYAWPALTDLFPWQHSGVQAKRTWPIAPDSETLQRRWKALLVSPDRPSAFRETRDRHVDRTYEDFRTGKSLGALASLGADSPCPSVEPYGYRSFDRQWLIADSRLGDFIRPVLWRIHSDRQVYLTSLLTNVLGLGPAATVSAYVPDLHHFRGSFGGKDAIPLWRDADATEPNVTAELLAKLGEALGRSVAPTDLFAYAYALLASPAYADRFWEEIRDPGPRLPLTKDSDLFQRAITLGSDLIRLHTYGERFTRSEDGHGTVPQGSARCEKAVGETMGDYPAGFEYHETTRTLLVGAGRFAPVHPRVWEFSVSGFQVVRSWLSYRMRDGAGRKSSPLDKIRPARWTAQFTNELLELLWTLEATLDHYPALTDLLDAITAGPTFTADELPQPSAQQRQAPKIKRGAARSTGYAQTDL